MNARLEGQRSAQAPNSGHWVAVAFSAIVLAMAAAPIHAQGVSAKGATGGLVIPSAEVLRQGDVAASFGTYPEPGLGVQDSRRNFTLGFGLLPQVEFFGRFAEYTTPAPVLFTGARDISANVKLQLPWTHPRLPKFAVGVLDMAGAAVFFRSSYVVATDQLGPFQWTLGFGRASRAQRSNDLDGVFGGVEWRIGATGFSALAEHDGTNNHVGLRYASPPIASLWHSRLIASAQRTFTDGATAGGSRNSINLSLLVPLGELSERRAALAPANALAPVQPQAAAGMVATAEDRLERLRKLLVAAGLERIRVGRLGHDVIVEYENHRYALNEADALGVVLGLASELAPVDTRRVYAVTLKAGLRLHESSIAVPEFRSFLRNADVHLPASGLAVDRDPTYDEAAVRWIDARPTGHSLVRFELKPDFAFQLGTEIGLFDHTLAADLQAFAPLWKGAELFGSMVQRIRNTENYEPGFFFENVRQRNGLRVAALHQSLALGRNVFANVGIGRYKYDSFGAQGELSLFVPGRDDVIRARASVYERRPGETRRQQVQVSGSYRWVHSPSAWLEAGWQHYSDGSYGPSIVFTRWFSDVAVNVVYRRGGDRGFGGVELSIPLTPRRGMAPGPVVFGGTSEFTTGVRTRVVSPGSINYVAPLAARDLQLDYNAQAQHLNRGRSSQRYYVSELHRMREAFYLYARDLLQDR